MLLGFKRRFALFVKDHSKRHTIRDQRKKRPRAGQGCHCYVDPRQKTMKLLGRFFCTRVEEIAIIGDGTPKGTAVRIGEAWLSQDERNALAWEDGFRTCGRNGAFAEMLSFWLKDRGKKVASLNFHGDIIYWNPEVGVPAPKRGRARRQEAAACSAG